MNDNKLKARKCALVLIDIDHFKGINDRWGHDMGDLVLADVAALIRGNVRKSDLVVRYGGEEMALLMPNTPLTVATDFAERIRNLIAEAEHELGGHKVQVTVSAGVAVLGVRMNDISEVVKAANKALYRAKSTAGSGRSGITAACLNNTKPLILISALQPPELGLGLFAIRAVTARCGTGGRIVVIGRGTSLGVYAESLRRVD